MNLAVVDREGRARLAAFQDGLLQLGWIEGRNVRLDIRWGAGDAERFRAYSSELVALAPDPILAASGTAVPPLLRATRSVPIVFVQAADPVGNVYVASLARPWRRRCGCGCSTAIRKGWSRPSLDARFLMAGLRFSMS